ncbi:hypothetical protein NU09_1107 [Flavobacterium beibuense]|uniref:Uncharacterized protein n=1 Tax=Flavobacterium beibuense TaxID=657326 RepID=A0A444WF94_9FLAO|nr:hypothetical protein NU09_1107 [Flavobacterium beibuense]
MFEGYENKDSLKTYKAQEQNTTHSLLRLPKPATLSEVVPIRNDRKPTA